MPLNTNLQTLLATGQYSGGAGRDRKLKEQSMQINDLNMQGKQQQMQQSSELHPQQMQLNEAKLAESEQAIAAGKAKARINKKVSEILSSNITATTNNNGTPDITGGLQKLSTSWFQIAQITGDNAYLNAAVGLRNSIKSLETLPAEKQKAAMQQMKSMNEMRIKEAQMSLAAIKQGPEQGAKAYSDMYQRMYQLSKGKTQLPPPNAPPAEINQYLKSIVAMGLTADKFTDSVLRPNSADTRHSESDMFYQEGRIKYNSAWGFSDPDATNPDPRIKMVASQVHTRVNELTLKYGLNQMEAESLADAETRLILTEDGLSHQRLRNIKSFYKQQAPSGFDEADVLKVLEMQRQKSLKYDYEDSPWEWAGWYWITTGKVAPTRPVQ